MDLSAIASMSTSFHMGNTMQAVSISMLKKSMEAAEVSNAQLIQSLQQAVPASVSGQILDTYA